MNQLIKLKRKFSGEILSSLKSEIYHNFTKENFVVSDQDFTRNRSLSFSITILFMLNFLTKSLSFEIENFLLYFKRQLIPQNPFTKSAFVQARKKIKPEVFVHLNKKLVEEFYTDNSAVKTKFKGKRILAVDRSRLTLPKTKELEQIYGQTKNQTDTTIVQAKACVLYDVLNKIGIGGVLSSTDTDERVQAKELLPYCGENDVLIYDRGYASFDFMYDHYQNNIDFVMRLRLDFNNVVKDFVKSPSKSEIVIFKPGKNTNIKDKDYDKNEEITVRLLKIVLSTGEIEILATSLLDKNKYPNHFFKSLYFERWKIETYYDELKNKLKIEYFSGYSHQSILQDFYASLLVGNIQSIIVEEINEEIQQEKGTKKYRYKVNNSLSYGFLKDRILGILFSTQDIDETSALKKLLKSHLIPIRPNRQVPRNVGKYRNRIKPKITKNQRDSL